MLRIGSQEILNSDLLLRPLLCDVYAHVCAPVCQPTQGVCEIVSALSGWGWGGTDLGKVREEAGVLAIIVELGWSKLR